VESGGKGAGFYTSIRERCKKRVGGDSEEEKITAWMTGFLQTTGEGFVRFVHAFVDFSILMMNS
jgi:hypothetical protein